MARVYNFSAGPSMLPLEVLKRAGSEITEYGETGQSVMEMSHRSKEYIEIFENCELKLREIMAIPENYRVLFLQGGAWLQFSMVPMNLAVKGKADYILTGNWAENAYKESQKFLTARMVASSKDDNYLYIPKIKPEDLDTEADYLHICQNNTIFGTQYSEIPEAPVPLVADASSMILGETMDVSKYGLIYAGAQKNMGCAGVTVVIIRDDLIERSSDNLPSMLSYKIQNKGKSMFNTPPTYAVYIMSLVLDWVKKVGGTDALEKINKEKASVLYDFIDNSKMYKCEVHKDSRSRMNVCFVTGNPEIDDKFCKEAAKEGLVNLKGHRLVGGIRASIYNAMPIEGVVALRDFMERFEKENS